MVYIGVSYSHKNWFPPPGLHNFSAPSKWLFYGYPATHFCSSKSHRYDKYDKPTNILSYPWSHKANLYQVIHFLPVTYNEENLKVLYNQDLKLEVTTKDIKKEDRLCMKSSTHEA